MAAPMKMLLSKSSLFLQHSRAICSQTVLLKHKMSPNKRFKKKPAPLDDFIRFGKREDDVYETGESVVDRFVDPAFEKAEKPHPETPKRGFYGPAHPYGDVYDKKPFPMVLEAGKRYLWCACGKSNRQPICDGTHKLHNRLMVERTNSRANHMRPIIFEVKEDGEYWLCNCKQSKNRPFCDGTHRSLDRDVTVDKPTKGRRR